MVPLGIPHSEFLSWSEDDQDKALAWQAEQADQCPSCGHPLRLTTDPDLRMTWQVEEATCFACLKSDAHRRNQADRDMAGVIRWVTQ